MFKRFSINYMVMLFLIDAALIQLALQWAIRLRILLPIGRDVTADWIVPWFYQPSIGLMGISFLWAFSCLVFSCYTPRRIIFWFDEFQRIILAHTFAALSLSGIFYLTQTPLLRLVFGYFYLLTLMLMLGYRVILRLWHRMRSDVLRDVARILIIGAGHSGQSLVREFRRQHWPGIEFVGYLDDTLLEKKILVGLPVLGKLDDAAQIVQHHSIDEVIIALPRDAHIHVANLAARLQELPVRLRIVPDYFDLAFHGATVESLGGIPLIGLRDPAIDGLQRFAKRLLDMLVAGLSLTFFAPLFALIAAAIKLEDGGPIFYWAPRVGENGQTFYMLKFRSMFVGADEMQNQVSQINGSGEIFHKSPEDPRITRVGRILRRTSMDELPQLYNVLIGEMSLVGPRPELPWLVQHYEPWQRKRFAVPQGITGWWQVNGRSDNMMHLHTEQDLYYIQNYSLWLDLQILWRTIGVVLRGKGAY